MALPLTEFNIFVLNPTNLGISQTGDIVSMRNLTLAGIQTVWSGGTGTAGSIIYEASNQDPAIFTAPIFTQLSSTAVSTTSGSVGLALSNITHSFVRVRWNRTAGTGGTIKILISGRRV